MDTAAAVNVESMLELIEDISDETPENKLLLVKQKWKMQLKSTKCYHATILHSEIAHELPGDV